MKRLRSFWRVGTLAVLAMASLGCPRAAEVVLDWGRVEGRVRALHGVNLGPLCYRGMVDLSSYHRALGVPVTRLHDVVWVNAEAVDLHTIFRDMRDDPALAANYDFRATDDYLRPIVEGGSAVVYRLGESIEHQPRKYWVHPPADPDRWAAVCLGVIRHYNEGWADGFRYGIRYWEIWNEPDVRPQMWTGTDEDFLRLFEVAARAIKGAFPDLKVGGPAVGGTGDFRGDSFVPAPFLAKFLAFCRDRKVPLDFFSWHRYTADPHDLPRRARAIRQLLDQHGFTATESHLNEWNYLPDDDWGPMMADGAGVGRERWFGRISGVEGAAFAATALILLQDAPVDVANYYTGEVQGFGLFNFHGTPRPTYHAFKAFRELLDTPLRLDLDPEAAEGWAVCGGLSEDRSRAQVLLARLAGADSRLVLRTSGGAWPGGGRYEVFRVTEPEGLVRVVEGDLGVAGRLQLEGFPGPAVILVRLQGR